MMKAGAEGKNYNDLFFISNIMQANFDVIIQDNYDILMLIRSYDLVMLNM